MKVLFKSRMLSVYIAVLAWSMLGVVLKPEFKLLTPMFFSIAGVFVLIVGLSQKWLRKHLSVIQLLWLLILADLVYIVITAMFNYQYDLKHMIMFHQLYDGIYMSIITASVGKLESYYIGKFKPIYQETIRSTISNNRIYAMLLGLSAGGVLSYFLTIHVIVYIHILLIVIGMINLLRALRS